MNDNIMNYTFSTLNDNEFEILVCDLLNSEFNLNLQSFKVGKDKGIDLRQSTDENSNAIVVQVKHYVESNYNQLKYKFSHEELSKVKLLNPNRYIIVTSLSLLAQQKDELKNIMNPYILNENDIIGREDLNRYLSKNHEIEKKHFKLYFSSINILNNILNNAIEGRTRHFLDRIKNRMPLLVSTDKINVANRILNKRKILLITGQPGIGKSTLSELIILDRARVGYKILKVEDISEAEDVISPNDDDKQLFYFDDFLGSNYNEIINSHKTETQLTSFIDRIKSTPNKYLILNTRTVILNQAKEKYEKINQANLNIIECELKLNDYTKYEKALILYNHMYFSKVPKQLLNKIIKAKLYTKIIEHINYTPRIIEFITDINRIEGLTEDEYIKFVFSNLDNPKEIWRHSFNNQINYIDRCLLLTLFTFEKFCSEYLLLNAFEKRMQYEKVKHGQIISNEQFQESTKVLINGFIIVTIYADFGNIKSFSFMNPSLTDFLIKYISESRSVLIDIISSIKYYEQLSRFDPTKNVFILDEEIQLIIKGKIESNEIIWNETNDEIKKLGKKIEMLCKYCRNIDKDDILLSLLTNIIDLNYLKVCINEIEYLLENIENSNKTEAYIKTNFIKIIIAIIESSADQFKVLGIINYFAKYDIEYNDFVESDLGFQIIFDFINKIVEKNRTESLNEKADEILTLEEVQDIFDETMSLEDELKSILLPNTIIDIVQQESLDKEYWENKIHENKINKSKNRDQIDNYMKYYRRSVIEKQNLQDSIDTLFYRVNDWANR